MISMCQSFLALGSAFAISCIYSGILFLLVVISYRYFAKLILRMVSRLFTEVNCYAQLQTPVRALVLCMGGNIAWDVLIIPNKLQAFGARVISSLMILNMCLIVYRIIPYLMHSAIARFNHEDELNNNIVNFLTKILHSVFILVTCVAFLQTWGVNMVSLLTAMGLGGMAISLAAKKVIENYFGTLTIFMDDTFMVGDKVKIGQIEGVVEYIGMRSTRIVTSDGGLAIIPNCDMVNVSIINYRPLQNSQPVVVGLDQQ